MFFTPNFAVLCQVRRCGENVDKQSLLKRYRRKNGMIALEAANPAYETRMLREDQVKVQGRLVGLIRSY